MAQAKQPTPAHLALQAFNANRPAPGLSQRKAHQQFKQFKLPPKGGAPGFPQGLVPNPASKPTAAPAAPGQAPLPAAPTPAPQPAPTQMPQAALTPGQAAGGQAQTALTQAAKVAKPIAAQANATAAAISAERLKQAQLNTQAAQLNKQRQGVRLAEQQAYNAQQEARAISNIAHEVSGSTQALANRLTTWAASLPTPGGILLMLFIIIAFLWAVVPVNNGLTRAQLFYLTLTGKTALDPTMVLGDLPAFSAFGALPGLIATSQTVAGTGPNSGSSSGSSQPSSQATQNLNFDFAPNLGPQYM